jgi:hypothetical protein
MAACPESSTRSGPRPRWVFLRSFTFGHVRQLDAIAARLLTRLTGATPLLPGADQWLTVVSTTPSARPTATPNKALGRGYPGVKGLNALLAVFSTPLSAPVIAATRLRKGSTNSARGAVRFLADALATARRVGATGVVLVRADSAYYGYDLVTTLLQPATRVGAGSRSPPVDRDRGHGDHQHRRAGLDRDQLPERAVEALA